MPAAEMWAVCGCGNHTDMTGGDARFSIPEGWERRHVGKGPRARVVLLCPGCLP